MDSELLPARINDLINICQKTSAPKFLGFLTTVQAAEAQKMLDGKVRHCFYGGYQSAERTMLCILPDWCEDPPYPITALTFTYRICDKLGHRDFLGALMALGITREKVGDILVEEGRTVAFIHSDLAKFVCSQIDKVGSVGVSVTEGYALPLPMCSKKQEFATTVASTRIDCVVSAICNISRNEASGCICDGLVAVNSVCCQKSTRTVNEGDIVTVRQKGRFEIVSCDGYSKKGRVILKYNKYM